MKKQLCVMDFCIRWEESWDPYIERSELKDTLWYSSYNELLKFVVSKKIQQRREWLSTCLLKEFLDNCQQ